ncbi:hypothetical protein Nepgr_023148 [Nepenthes gracilis]|uniref:Uncharacterized protein n=1 Tax=Nepenthes gracilis TaxID=150966 RepID=A0AAD3T3T2_NEPGR|nr:hypothetical protein Nepgr_023148 [Nepenthes gracilis]
MVGGSPSEQVSLSTHSRNPTSVVSELGPLGPVPTVALSLPGVPGSPGFCDGEVGASPRPKPHFPCQASSLGDLGLYSDLAPLSTELVVTRLYLPAGEADLVQGLDFSPGLCCNTFKA